MPNPLKELGSEFPDEGINGVDFECKHCRQMNFFPTAEMKNIVQDAEATAMFLVYQKRMNQPMFKESEVNLIANAALSYMVGKRSLYNRRKN